MKEKTYLRKTSNEDRSLLYENIHKNDEVGRYQFHHHHQHHCSFLSLRRIELLPLSLSRMLRLPQLWLLQSRLSFQLPKFSFDCPPPRLAWSFSLSLAFWYLANPIYPGLNMKSWSPEMAMKTRVQLKL